MEAPLGAGDHGVGSQPRRANPIPANWQRAISTAITSGLLSLIAIGPVAGQNCIEYTDYLHFVGSLDTPGHPVGVAVTDDHAYVADAGDEDDPSNLFVLDISTAMPEIVGSVQTTGAAQDVAFDGIFAYVVSSSNAPSYHSGLEVVDVSNAASPVIVGSVNTPDNSEIEWARSVVLAGTYAYVAISTTYAGRLDIIDISNPALPAIIGSVGLPLRAVDVAVAGTHAYVATGYCNEWECIGALEVVDVSNPALPAIVTSVAMYDVYGVVVAGTHAYVTGYHPSAYGLRLFVFDISNPIFPAIVGSVIINSIGGLAVAGNLAYIAGGSGLEVIDITNPASPAIISGTGLPDSGYGVTVAGNYAYLTGSDLGVVDISNPTSPAIIGGVDMELAGRVVVAGNLAYVAGFPGFHGVTSLQVVDVSNPASPVILGSVSLPSSCWAPSVAVSGNYAYVPTGCCDDGLCTGALQVVDVSNPAAPIIVGSALISSSRAATCVAVAGTHAYVTTGLCYNVQCTGGLEVFDVSNPALPTRVTSVPMEYAHSVMVAGNYANVVAGHVRGLRVVDISNPAAPVMVCSMDVPGAVEVAVAGDLACVAVTAWSGGGGLEILDVSNPGAPIVIGSIDTSGADNVAIDGIYAYASNRFGVRVIDISDPASPVFVGGANVLSLPYVTDVAVANGLVYLADYSNGLIILPTQCQAPTSVETPLSTAGEPQYLLAQNHPNPFVAEGGPTTIGFTLGEQVHAKLRVFDASGRLVRLLIDEELDVGPHTARWDGRNEVGGNTASGIYYYRLEAGEFSEARALVKLR